MLDIGITDLDHIEQLYFERWSQLFFSAETYSRTIEVPAANLTQQHIDNMQESRKREFMKALKASIKAQRKSDAYMSSQRQMLLVCTVQHSELMMQAQLAKYCRENDFAEKLHAAAFEVQMTIDAGQLALAG